MLAIFSELHDQPRRDDPVTRSIYIQSGIRLLMLFDLSLLAVCVSCIIQSTLFDTQFELQESTDNA